MIYKFLNKKRLDICKTNEVNVFNVALFDMLAKEYRENNPKLAKNGNIRDYTDLLHLIILSNLETINASLISDNVSQREIN